MICSFILRNTCKKFRPGVNFREAAPRLPDTFEVPDACDCAPDDIAMELAPNAFSAGLDAMAESMVHATLAGPKMPMACELEALVDEYVFGAAKLWADVRECDKSGYPLACLGQPASRKLNHPTIKLAQRLAPSPL